MEQINDVPQKYDYTEPRILIGVGLFDDFVKHYKQTYNKRTREEFDQAVKTIPDNIRIKVSEAYHRLRESGWYADGIDKYENIIWKRAIINPVIDTSPMPDVKEQVKRIKESKADMIQATPDADIFKDYKDEQY